MSDRPNEASVKVGNCKDCKYWETYGNSFYYPTEWKECDRPDRVMRYDPTKDDEVALYADALDDSGLTAGLKTGPMFGCVHFTAKTPPKEKEE